MDLRGGMSTDRIITVSRILYLDLNVFCTLVADYGNLNSYYVFIKSLIYSFHFPNIF